MGVATVTGSRRICRCQNPGGTPRELEVAGWTAGGNKVTARYTGPTKGIAGSDIKLALPELRSQQIDSVGFPPFADDDNSVHEYNIWVIEYRGVAKGYPGGNFCPGDAGTREQMATFLAKAFSLSGGDPSQFTDIASSLHRDAHRGHRRRRGHHRLCRRPLLPRHRRHPRTDGLVHRPSPGLRLLRTAQTPGPLRRGRGIAATCEIHQN